MIKILHRFSENNFIFWFTVCKSFQFEVQEGIQKFLFSKYARCNLSMHKYWSLALLETSAWELAIN